MAACYLDRFLNAARPDNERIGIVCIESPRVPTVGVGEATVPNLLSVLRYLGISETGFLLRTEGTFKQAIRFEGWNRARDPKDYYFHTFDAGAQAVHPPLAHHWMAMNPKAGEPAFAAAITYQAALCERLRAPRGVADAPYQSSVPYAYHMDATLFAGLLNELAVERGVRHISARMVGVSRAENGFITGLTLDNGDFVEGDLFVDCSGFASLLLEGEMGVGFRGFHRHLPCDKAVAMRVPRPADAPLVPYTRAITAPSGWIWRIPLYGREGCGYVYSSDYCKPGEAERFLRKAVNATDDVPTQHLDMRTGCHDVCWHKNCVAIGLAAGFIEPLESTGIYLSEIGVRALADNFPFDLEDCEPLRGSFNRLMDGFFDELINFIVFHYTIAGRSDTPFWRHARDPARRTDRLEELIALWRFRPPNIRDAGLQGQQFNHVSYDFVLAGTRPDFSRQYRPTGEMPEAHYRAILDRVRQLRDLEWERLPDHRAYLRGLREAGEGNDGQR